MGHKVGQGGAAVRGSGAVVALLLLAACGHTPSPGASTPKADASPQASPTITATLQPPLPTASSTSSPLSPDPRGISVLRQNEAEAAAYASALEGRLDDAAPGHTHTVTCTPVMLLAHPGAHTPCEVSTDSGTPVLWTALTQEHPDPPGGGTYIEFTVGEPTDVTPWPPVTSR